jgi:hypothetical protein
MSEADWNLESNEERGQLEALREEKFLEDYKEKQWQRRQDSRCLNCEDVASFTKEQKCINCGAILPSDIAFQEYHMRKMHKLEV